jgi:cysteine desulfurase
MAPFWADSFGNPSSPHWMGAEAEKAVASARSEVAGLLGAAPREILFTSSGTEANNLAVAGVILRALREHERCHVVTTAVEHHSVLHACRAWEGRGVRLTVLEPDREGLVGPEDLADACGGDTILASVIGANNETGVLQDVKALAEAAHGKGVPLHVDGVQMAGKVPVNVEDLGADLFSLASHKIYGPKGAGALFVRRGVNLEPILHGGEQERGLRAGTENVAALVGFGEAARLALGELEAEGTRLRALRDGLEERLEGEYEGLRFNGRGAARVPNTSNVSFEGLDGEAAILSLEMKKIAVASGAACASGAAEPSHVLRAMGLTTAEAKGSLRVSLGRSSGPEDLEAFLEALQPIVHRLRRLSSHAT